MPEIKSSSPPCTEEEINEVVEEIETDVGKLLDEIAADEDASKEELEGTMKICEVVVEKVQQIHGACKKRVAEGKYGNGRNR